MKGISSPKIKRKILIRMALVAFFALRPVKAHPQDGTPVADAGLSRYAGPDPVVLDGTGSYDPDSSGPLSYTWRQVSGPPVVIVDANIATPTIAGSIQPGPGRDPTPKPQGFLQTDEIQECEFELIVRDGELISQPDSVKVIIVPYFGESTLKLENAGFDTSKPTLIYFGGGDGVRGYTGQPWNGGYRWTNAANVIWFPNGYEPDSGVGAPTYYKYGDMIITYLSTVAPNYEKPIQTCGWSTGGQPAVDVGIHLNITYGDPRYAINHVTYLDSWVRLSYYQDWDLYFSDSDLFLRSSVAGEQCWIDSYYSKPHEQFPFRDMLPVSLGLEHHEVRDWYRNSPTSDDTNLFNSGVVAGAYWSIIGPGKNLQLTAQTYPYYFRWDGNVQTGGMSFFLQSEYPGRLPEPVTLVGPLYTEDHNGVILSCEESENAIGYQLLFGTDTFRVMDFSIISDTPAPPNDVITTLPFDEGWWTVRIHDQYGSTIYADPIHLSVFASEPNPPDGAMLLESWATLSWTEGIRTTSYNVYFGKNFINVQEGNAETFQGNQTSRSFVVGFAGFPYPDGLVPGTMYFWRIDDVGTDGTVIHKGKIWSFRVSP